MTRRLASILLAVTLWTGVSYAEEGGTNAEYLWTKETTVETFFEAQMGFGLLDDPGFTGGRGTPITDFFGAAYAFLPNFGMSIGLPLAGSLSSGADDYGIGNIVLGGKVVIPMERLRFALGMDIALPTAQSSAAIGIFTRPYSYFVDDQFAISPYAAVSFTRDRLTLSVDAGTDFQIYSTAPAGAGDFEDVIFYDAAVAMAVYENIWTTVEFGGYSRVTYDNFRNQFFAGPGIRYQDHELSLGSHIAAPFRSPDKDTIDFQVIFDFRLLF
ncbi:MAG TPA: transporter [Bdellovibrionota bacterium]|nr:transporter [Bdellovibrionota bacterium]